MRVRCWCCELCMEAQLLQRNASKAGDEEEVFVEARETSDGELTSEIVDKSDRAGSVDSGKPRTSSDSDSHYADSKSASMVDVDDALNKMPENSHDNSLDGSLENGDELSAESNVSPACFQKECGFLHALRPMSYHGQYLRHFFNTHEYLMFGTGPLPSDVRFFIAIMASARHRCSYLVDSFAADFIRRHGDPTWLLGLDRVPKKIRNLSEVNRILAHRPWLLSNEHLEKLTKGADMWSISELTQALVILAHCHSLASFVFACGVSYETDQTKFHIQSTSGSNSDHGSFDNSGSDSEVEVEFIVEQMKRLSTEAAAANMTQDELRQQFEKMESQTAALTTKKKSKKKKVPTATLR